MAGGTLLPRELRYLAVEILEVILILLLRFRVLGVVVPHGGGYQALGQYIGLLLLTRANFTLYRACHGKLQLSRSVLIAAQCSGLSVDN